MYFIRIRNFRTFKQITKILTFFTHQKQYDKKNSFNCFIYEILKLQPTNFFKSTSQIRQKLWCVVLKTKTCRWIYSFICLFIYFFYLERERERGRVTLFDRSHKCSCMWQSKHLTIKFNDYRINRNSKYFLQRIPFVSSSCFRRSSSNLFLSDGCCNFGKYLNISM